MSHGGLATVFPSAAAAVESDFYIIKGRRMSFAKL
jgi:hypothetical protein